jgi:hypothetical protein
MLLMVCELTGILMKVIITTNFHRKTKLMEDVTLNE